MEAYEMFNFLKKSKKKKTKKKEYTDPFSDSNIGRDSVF